MGNGGGEQIAVADKVLGHEAAVRGADTAYLTGIDKRIAFAGLLYGRHDFATDGLGPVIDVARGEFLAVTDGAGGLQNQYDITVRRPNLFGITHIQRLGRGRRPAVVIRDAGVLARACLQFFERQAVGQIERTVDAVAGGRREFEVEPTVRGHALVRQLQLRVKQPFLAAARLRVGQRSLAQISADRLVGRRTRVEQLVAGHGHALGIGGFQRHADKDRLLAVKAATHAVGVEIDTIAVGAAEIDIAARRLERKAVYGGPEVPPDEMRLFGGDIENKRNVVVVVGVEFVTRLAGIDGRIV